MTERQLYEKVYDIELGLKNEESKLKNCSRIISQSWNDEYGGIYRRKLEAIADSLCSIEKEVAELITER